MCAITPGFIHSLLLKTRFTYLFIILYVWNVLPAYRYAPWCFWCLWRPKKGIGSLELELEMVVSHLWDLLGIEPKQLVLLTTEFSLQPHFLPLTAPIWTEYSPLQA